MTHLSGHRPKTGAACIAPEIADFARRWRNRAEAFTYGLEPLLKEGIVLMDSEGAAIIARPNPWGRTSECGIASLGVLLEAQALGLGEVRRLSLTVPYLKTGLRRPLTHSFSHGVVEIVNGASSILVDPTPFGRILGFRDGVLPSSSLNQNLWSRRQEVSGVSANLCASVKGGGLSLVEDGDGYRVSYLPLGSSRAGGYPLLNARETERGELILVTGGVLTEPSGLINVGFRVNGPLIYDSQCGNLVATESYMAQVTMDAAGFYRLHDAAQQDGQEPETFAARLFSNGLGLPHLRPEVLKSRSVSASIMNAVQTGGAGLYYTIRNFLFPQCHGLADMERKLEKIARTGDPAA